MAALTATSKETEVIGRRRQVRARLPAVSDGDTFDTGLKAIVTGTVQVTFADAATVAADSIAVGAISGGVITFETAGTARTVNVQATGW